ncbi:hypothetical protein VCRA2116O233_280062 [Vibrio crassostreae]|nr:hypothetical protein VCRA2116O233_280062 [Vibrio crassostreae]
MFHRRVSSFLSTYLQGWVSIPLDDQWNKHLDVLQIQSFCLAFNYSSEFNTHFHEIITYID